MLMDRKRPPSGSLCVYLLAPVLLMCPCTFVCVIKWNEWNVCVCVCLCVLDAQMVFTSWLMDEGLLAPAFLALCDTLLF